MSTSSRADETTHLLAPHSVLGQEQVEWDESSTDTARIAVCKKKFAVWQLGAFFGT